MAIPIAESEMLGVLPCKSLMRLSPSERRNGSKLNEIVCNCVLKRELKSDFIIVRTIKTGKMKKIELANFLNPKV